MAPLTLRVHEKKGPKRNYIGFSHSEIFTTRNMNIFYFLQSNGDKYAIEISFALS